MLFPALSLRMVNNSEFLFTVSWIRILNPVQHEYKICTSKDKAGAVLPCTSSSPCPSGPGACWRNPGSTGTPPCSAHQPAPQPAAPDPNEFLLGDRIPYALWFHAHPDWNPGRKKTPAHTKLT